MKKNAIHKRLDELTDVWVQFTENENGRLFKFIEDDENADLIEAFVSYHQEVNSGLADLFLRFENPFVDPRIFGKTLQNALVEIYQHKEFKEMMQEGGVASDWIPPVAQRRENDYVNFANCCKSFFNYHKDDLDHLVLVLTPSEIELPKDWRNWLFNLIDMTYSKEVRFIVIDKANAPILDSVPTKLTEKVVTHHPFINMMEILEELAADGDPNNPGVQFRKCFVGIGKAAADKDEQRIKAEAQKGLQIVDQQEWYPLKVTLYMALGGAYMALQKPEDSLNSYRKAREAAGLSDGRGG